MKKILFFLTIMLIFTEISYSESTLRFTQIKDTPDEILKAAYSKIGIPIEMVIMPGKRALKESSEGRADGEVHRIFKIGEVYPTLIRVPTPINYIEPSVFSKKYDFKVTGCSGLKDYSIGIVRGVKHAELCTEGMSNVQVLFDSTKMMELLDVERIDIAITARINGLWLTKKMNMKSVHPLSPPLSRMSVYHYLHKKHKKLVPEIDKIFAEMKENGELETLREKSIETLLKSAEDR